MPKKLTTEDFIEKANKIHNFKYEYIDINYINNKSKIKIQCKEHGEFEQRVDSHLHGSGCPRCSKISNYYDFVIKANKIHNNKYKYTIFKWNSHKDKIDILCKKHGSFKQIINDHLNGSGCKKCNLHMLSEEDFFKKVKEINKNYDYSKTIFKNNSKIKIICNIHGEFEQNIWDHYNGAGCPTCAHKNLNTDDIITNFNNVHNFRYDYSKTEYVSSDKKVIIICKKHGEFKQSPNHHSRGKGCPKCNNSKGELSIEKYLIDNNIKYITQKTFDDCVYKQKLRFDFYLPDIITCIEYDGEQHFRSHIIWGEEKLKLTQIRDKIKTDYCKYNNINLIRIRYNENIEEKLNQIINI